MRRTSRPIYFLRASLGLATALVLATAAHSQQKTPSHVYQAVGALEQKTRLILEADFADVDGVTQPASPPRKPRHVYAKLVEIGGKVAMLRRLNGLSHDDMLAMPAQTITPGDVFAGLEKVSASVDGLLGDYGLASPTGAEPLQEGRKPGDVYARLTLVSRLLDKSFIPATVPNDVYRIAATILREAAMLSQALGGDAAAKEIRRSNKSPSDVLKAAVRFSTELGELAAARADVEPGGGVFVPAEIEGKVSPADVRDALNLVLADILEMRVKAGVSTPFELAPQPVGKTPSDVFSRIEEARALLASVSRS